MIGPRWIPVDEMLRAVDQAEDTPTLRLALPLLAPLDQVDDAPDVSLTLRPVDPPPDAA